MKYIKSMTALSLLLTTVVNQPVAQAAEGPSSFSYEGRLYDSTTNAPSNHTVNLVLQVLHPTDVTAGVKCILREEKISGLNLALSDGYFSVAVGSGTLQPNDPGLSMVQAFVNTSVNGKRTDNGAACTTSGAGGMSRLLRVTVEDVTASTVATLSPDVGIGTTPYALAADSLQGFTPADLLKTAAAAPALTQANLESLFGGSNFPTLMSIIAGTSSSYVTSTATKGTAVFNGAPTTPVAGSVWFDGGALKYYDGGATQTLGVAGAGITSIIAGTGLTGGTITTTGTIGLNNTGVTPGTYGNSTQASTFTVDAQGRITNASATSFTLPASSIVSGTLASSLLPIVPVNKGGTNSPTALANNRLIVSSGGALVEAPQLNDGQVFIGQTGGAPLPATLTAGSGVTITNGAGSITISAIGGGSVSPNSVGSPEIIDGSVNTPDISNNAITFGKFQDINGDRLIGRGPGGVGPASEITLGSGLSLSGGSLSLAGGLGNFQSNGSVPMTGQFLANTGSQTLPGVTFGGDNNTGLFQFAADALGFTTNGTTKMVVDASGNVGIGTTTPAHRLHVFGGAGSSRIESNASANVLELYNSNGGSWQNAIKFFSGATTGWEIGNDSTNGGSNDFYLYSVVSNWNPIFADGANKRVGIGITNPTTALDVAGAISAGSMSGSLGGEVQFKEANSGLNYVALRGPSSVVSNVTWTLPASDGSANQVLSTNGAGVLSWASAATGNFQSNGSVPMTAPLLGAAGSSLSPSFTFSGDPDTGIFSSGPNAIGFSTTGQQRMVLDSVGRLGVGLSSPQSVLHSWFMGTSTSAPEYSGRFDLMVNPGSPSTATSYASYGNASYATSISSPSANVIGSYGGVTNTGTGQLGNAIGVKGVAYTQATGGITTGIGGYFETQESVGTIGTGYGVKIGPIAGTAKWSLYVSDASAPSYFNGNVGIGTTLPSAPLSIYKLASGPTDRAVKVEQFVTAAAATVTNVVALNPVTRINTSTYAVGGTMTGILADVADGGGSGGSIERLVGVSAQVGGTGGSITKNNVVGLHSRYAMAGSTQNYFGLLLDVPLNIGGSAPTNSYGIYQADGSSKNVFLGRVLVGANTMSTALFEADGGQAPASNPGSNIVLKAGHAGVGNASGGSVLIVAGTNSGTASHGSVEVDGPLRLVAGSVSYATGLALPPQPRQWSFLKVTLTTSGSLGCLPVASPGPSSAGQVLYVKFVNTHVSPQAPFTKNAGGCTGNTAPIDMNGTPASVSSGGGFATYQLIYDGTSYFVVSFN